MMTRFSFPVWTLTLAVLGSFAASPASGTKGEEPRELTKAREVYEAEFFRRIGPVQRKYRRALENYQRTFTRDGDLDAAREAQAELKRLSEWKTVPVKAGMRTLDNAQLQSLLQGYERAALGEIEPIVEKYRDTLERNKEKYTSAGNLEAALSLDEEIENLRSGKSLPGEIAGRAYLSFFSRREFSDWLTKQLFEFTGKIAGNTVLDFEEDKLQWDNGQKEYDYAVTGDRTVEIGFNRGRKAPFLIHFSKDLRSAAFKSDRGIYPLKINGEDPEDFESLKAEVP
ncbi:MAG: hypothetical protein WD342_01530 [Verrucomicrobiales bacterium]